MPVSIAPFIAAHKTLADANSLSEEYLPESDGKPMAETARHRDEMINALHGLREHFRDHPQVYITGNIFVYYLDENGERQAVSPDIWVVTGVEKKERRIYKIDAEGKAPEVVIELTSASTKVEDLVTKHYIYANLGVREYFLFDPYNETGRSALRGLRLEGGEYVPMNGDALRSEVLGLELKVQNNHLRFYDPQTNELLRTPEEAEADRRIAEAARHAAEKKAAQELKARQETETKASAAEAEVARLREELAKLHGKPV